MNPLIPGARAWAVGVALAIIVTGCAGDWGEPTMPKGEARRQDAALIAAVEESGGVVSIGFKDAGSRRGVGERGEVLASDTAVATARAFLRDLGVTIVYEFALIPAVIAKIDPSLAPTIRRQPNVDYVEASTPGTFGTSAQ